MVAACSTGMPPTIAVLQDERRRLKLAQAAGDEVWPLHGAENVDCSDAVRMLDAEISAAAEDVAKGLDEEEQIVPFREGTQQHATWSRLDGNVVRLAAKTESLVAEPEWMNAYTVATRRWLHKAWKKPVGTARQLARYLQQIATHGVIKPKEQEKRAKGCTPLVFSTGGAVTKPTRRELLAQNAESESDSDSDTDSSADSSDEAECREGFWTVMRPADLPEFYVTVSCALLQGAAMCDVRVRRASN